MSLIQKFRNIRECRDNSEIYDVYYKENLDDKLIYFESRNGLDFAGNIFRIIKELSNGNYGDFKINVFALNDVSSKIRQFQKNYNLKIDKIISNEKEASKILEKAKYIFTDSGIRPKYIKKDGQIFVNTWHGTPLKLMGKDNPGEITSIGHIQHSLLSADYLIYPNDYMMEKMMKSYMIDRIYPGEVLLEGYPRNSTFFVQSLLKDKFNLTDTEIFVYMPTFRGDVNDKKDADQKNDIEGFLSKIDLNLKDNQLLFVKLHPYNESQIDFTNYDKIKQFPVGFETYDVINMADCLITDYSSVFFDFANTLRKIIIFNYDEEDYLKDRGLYFPLSDLPYPKVSDIDELISELNLDKNYDDSQFVEEYCRYDNPDAAKRICEHIFKNNDSCITKDNFNEANNILVYAGSLTDDRIDEVAKLLKPDYNYYITFKQWDEYILKNHEHILEKIPGNVYFLPFRSNLTLTVNEKRDYNKYFKSDDGEFPQSLHNLYARTFDKQFKNLNFKAIVNLDMKGYDESFIFTHSDVKTILICDGIQSINNKSKDTLKRFDRIFVPDNELKSLLSEHIDDNKINLINEWDDIL
ncbi:MAG: CDP-glycerol glycerophosphotransferase family protein [Methanobrevibacter sp.]|uniref:CDP-glycerol glycerophosphotransferase family protein n=1 Tax=Methanobrevibacter sp. TaxID=66852 RepID=UPI0025F23DAB|nr:CDP-glycerol glycerophosphotransferase family protein [Methanobrevibacter sp.]MBQ8018720.1 CDP-glycerol glycerophosphotransferase family protein [Methanobrevibacter sp.]